MLYQWSWSDTAKNVGLWSKIDRRLHTCPFSLQIMFLVVLLTTKVAAKGSPIVNNRIGSVRVHVTSVPRLCLYYLYLLASLSRWSWQWQAKLVILSGREKPHYRSQSSEPYLSWSLHCTCNLNLQDCILPDLFDHCHLSSPFCGRYWWMSVLASVELSLCKMLQI